MGKQRRYINLSGAIIIIGLIFALIAFITKIFAFLYIGFIVVLGGFVLLFLKGIRNTGKRR